MHLTFHHDTYDLWQTVLLFWLSVRNSHSCCGVECLQMSIPIKIEIRQPLQGRSSCVGRRPVLLQPLDIAGSGHTSSRAHQNLFNGAQSALWAEINRQLTKIRVRRIFRAVRFERFDQWTTSNNITDWLIFLLMLAWTVTFADVGARNRHLACKIMAIAARSTFTPFHANIGLLPRWK